MPAIRPVLVIVMLVLAMIVISSPARTEITVGRFQRMIERDETLLMALYLHSFMQAASAMQADYVQNGRQKPFSCWQATSTVSAQNVLDALARELRANAEFYKPDTPLAPVLVDVLKHSYPCT